MHVSPIDNGEPSLLDVGGSLLALAKFGDDFPYSTTFDGVALLFICFPVFYFQLYSKDFNTSGSAGIQYPLFAGSPFDYFFTK